MTHLVVLLTLSLTASSCSLMAKTNHESVHSFVTLTDEYVQLPTTLVRSYSGLILNNKLLSIARRDYGLANNLGQIETESANKAWEELVLAYKMETEYDIIAKRLTAALEVLSQYSVLLKQISSDELEQTLDSGAVKLGQSVDKAAKDYGDNFRPDRPLTKLGESVAQASRVLLGVALSSKRHKLLEKSVKAADPLIEEICAEIKVIASAELSPALDNYEQNYLGASFRSFLNTRHQISYSDTQAAYNDYRKLMETRKLAQRTVEIGEQYRLLHQQLLKNLEGTLSFDELKSQAQALAEQVKDAQKLRKQFKEKKECE